MIVTWIPIAKLLVNERIVPSNKFSIAGLSSLLRLKKC